MPTIDTFRQNFYGTRPNRYLIIPQWPDRDGFSLNPAPDDSTVYCYINGADVPGASIGKIQVPWMGRLVNFSGERSYSDWVINIYESNIMERDLRSSFERWIELMDNRSVHHVNYNLATEWKLYWSDIEPQKTYSEPNSQNEAQISEQFNKSITLMNCFPIDISTGTLQYNLTDSFAEFSITLTYDYWVPNDEGASLSFVGPPAP